jgi:hypothetical protein
MASDIHWKVLALVLPAITGCMPGLIYTNTTTPLVTNMNATPANGKVVYTENEGFKVPLSRIPLSAQWRKDLVGEAAKANGLTTIYYADIERFSILGGIWQESSIRIVGE